MIDLRSDTVTKPSLAMRQAMFDAEVGDDVYGEDPTVNRLEARAAEISGKPAALFVPTGTMANTIALKVLTRHGQEIIADSRSHLMDWELSMTAWFAGCLIRAIETPDGILTWEKIAPQIKPGSAHAAPTGAITIENTHNMAGGRVYPLRVIDELCERAHERGIRVHLDGARIFNAAAASGESVSRIATKADTVAFCLSKALGAPAGSLLAGSRELMDEARLLRKRLGGGMRQAGILAAAGLVALEEGPRNLPQDHANAQLIAERMRRIPGISVFPCETNIVVFDISATGRKSGAISDALRERGVLMNGFSDQRMRALTHRDVTRDQCEEAMEIFEAVITATSRA